MTQAGSSTTPDKDGFPDPPIRRVDSSATRRGPARATRVDSSALRNAVEYSDQ